MDGWVRAFALLLLAPAALAGCLQKPDIGVTADDCAAPEGCASPPATPAHPSENETVPEPVPVASYPCGECYCPPDAGCICSACVEPAYDPLGPLEPRLVASNCAGCRDAAVVAADDGRVFVATEDGLRVVDPDGVTEAAAPAPALRAPSVALSGPGVWFAAISDEHPAPALVVAEWDDGWASVRRLDATRAPALLVAESVHVTTIDGNPLVILVTPRDAWAIRWVDAVAVLDAEPITPPAGVAKVGAPTRDEKGAVHVPYAWEYEDTAQRSLSPSPAYTVLAFATLREAWGEWSTHGGMTVAVGPAEGTAPAFEASRERFAFTYVDESRTLVRVEGWDSGSSWSGSEPWSEPTARAVGTPASVMWGDYSTAAWWERQGDGARLVLARGQSALPYQEAVAPAASDVAPARAALAVTPGGRAVLAWVAGDELWTAVEHGWTGGCDDTAHCVAWW